MRTERHLHAIWHINWTLLLMDSLYLLFLVQTIGTKMNGSKWLAILSFKGTLFRSKVFCTSANHLPNPVWIILQETNYNHSITNHPLINRITLVHFQFIYCMWWASLRVGIKYISYNAILRSLKWTRLLRIPIEVSYSNHMEYWPRI